MLFSILRCPKLWVPPSHLISHSSSVASRFCFPFHMWQSNTGLGKLPKLDSSDRLMVSSKGWCREASKETPGPKQLNGKFLKETVELHQMKKSIMFIHVYTLVCIYIYIHYIDSVYSAQSGWHTANAFHQIVWCERYTQCVSIYLYICYIIGTKIQYIKLLTNLRDLLNRWEHMGTLNFCGGFL